MSELLVRLEWFKAVVLPHEATVRSRLRRICPQGFDVDNLVAEKLILHVERTASRTQLVLSAVPETVQHLAFVGGALGIISFFLRLSLEESKEFSRIRAVAGASAVPCSRGSAGRQHHRPVPGPSLRVARPA